MVKKKISAEKQRAAFEDDIKEIICIGEGIKSDAVEIVACSKALLGLMKRQRYPNRGAFIKRVERLQIALENVAIEMVGEGLEEVKSAMKGMILRPREIDALIGKKKKPKKKKKSQR